jgi:hypothetical protein
MNVRTYACFLTLASISLALFVTGTGYGLVAGSSDKGKGAKASDPHLTGPRDMNYDHLIVAGERIGPVKMGGSVSDAVQHLGNPSIVKHLPNIPNEVGSNVVYYWYKDECIGFYWQDSGIDPVIEAHAYGINVTCDKWSTPDGLHVGSSVKDVSAHIGRYCPANPSNQPQDLFISTYQGIWYQAKDRNSPVTSIRVMPVGETAGYCAP